ncbi:MAG: hypothetical protein IT266_06230 [Saprospiraceae bacterium]|nr:hypothetical protein [Saprospiraceae bacterium]
MLVASQVNLSYGALFLALCLSACAAGGARGKLQSANEQLTLRNDSLAAENLRYKSHEASWEQTREQLRKTEEALIQFYKRYEGKTPPSLDGNGASPRTDDCSALREENLFLKESVEQMQRETAAHKLFGEDLNVSLDSLKDVLDQRTDALEEERMRRKEAEQQLADAQSVKQTSSNRQEQVQVRRIDSLQHLLQQRSEALEREGKKRKEAEQKLADASERKLKSQRRDEDLQTRVIDSLNRLLQQRSESLEMESKKRKEAEQKLADASERKLKSQRREEHVQAHLVDSLQGLLQQRTETLVEEKNNRAIAEQNLATAQRERDDALQKADEFRVQSERMQKEAQGLEEVGPLRTEVANLRQKSDQLNRLLMAKTSEADELKIKLDEHNQRLETAERDVNSLERTVVALNELIDSKNGEIQTAKEESTGLREQLARTREENARIASEAAGAKQMAGTGQKFESERKELQRKIDQAEKERRAQEDAIEACRDRSSELEAELSRREEQLARLKEEEKKSANRPPTNERQTVSMDSLENLKAAFSTLQRNLDASRVREDSLGEQIRLYQSRARFLESQLREAETANIKLQSDRRDASAGTEASHIPEEVLRRYEQRVTAVLMTLGPKSAALSKGSHGPEMRLSQSLLFQANSYAMTARGSEVLSTLAPVLKEQPGLHFLVSGFSAAEGAEAQSVDAMVRYASTVFKLLSALGIPPDRMRIGARRLAKAEFPSGIEIRLHEE